MKIGMIGAVYVGFVSWVCVSGVVHDVFCVDKVAMLPGGEVPICELGLGAVLGFNVAVGTLYFDADPTRAADGANAVFVREHAGPSG